MASADLPAVCGDLIAQLLRELGSALIIAASVRDEIWGPFVTAAFVSSLNPKPMLSGALVGSVVDGCAR